MARDQFRPCVHFVLVLGSLLGGGKFSTFKSNNFDLNGYADGQISRKGSID